MNLNLKYNSIAFYQISKLLCIPVSLMIERLSIVKLKKQDLTYNIIISIILIIIGMLFIIDGEIKYDNYYGIIFMILGVLISGRQKWEKIFKISNQKIDSEFKRSTG